MATYNNNITNISDRFIYDKHKNITGNLSGELNLNVQYLDNNGKGLVKDRINDALNQKNPVVILINPSYISYNMRQFQPVGRDEMHSFAIYGVDTDKSIFYVADSTVVDEDGMFTCCKATMPINVVLEHGVCAFWFDISDDLQMNRRYVLESLVDNLEEFLAGSFDNKNNCFHGVSAIIKMFEDIKISRDAEIISEIKFLMKAYFIPVLDYLMEVLEGGPEFGYSSTNEIAIVVRNLKIVWNKFFYKMLREDSQNSEDMYQLVNKALDIIETEKEVFTEVISYCRNEYIEGN